MRAHRTDDIYVHVYDGNGDGGYCVPMTKEEREVGGFYRTRCINPKHPNSRSGQRRRAYLEFYCPCL